MSCPSSTPTVLRCLLACTAPHGEADLLAFQVVADEQEIDGSRHVQGVQEWAKANGYREPFVCFDEGLDLAAEKLASCFDWEKEAAVIDACGRPTELPEERAKEECHV